MKTSIQPEAFFANGSRMDGAGVVFLPNLEQTSHARTHATHIFFSPAKSLAVKSILQDFKNLYRRSTPA